MKWRVAVFTAVVALSSSVEHAAAEFNQCLGVQIDKLPTIENCNVLYDACVTGVVSLNVQLMMGTNDLFQPVSLVSATETRAKSSNESMIAMLVQLAPIKSCPHSKRSPKNVARCTFDMNKMEVYSILLRQARPTTRWSLDGYKHHALSDGDRAQIVAEYKSGQFFGSNLAIGIFDTPNLPAVAVSDSSDMKFSRSPLGIFAVLASATVSVGLLFHYRRRLHNGYAPIVIVKRGRPQSTSMRRPQYGDARSKMPIAVVEEISLKREASERFAV